jgi:hypothetical protein
MAASGLLFSQENQFSVLAETGITPASAVSYGSKISANLGGKKFAIAFTKTTAGANVTAPVIFQGSIDGTNYADIGSVITADLTPDVADTVAFQVDFAAVWFPYYRLAFNKTSEACTTAVFAYKIAVPPR